MSLLSKLRTVAAPEIPTRRPPSRHGQAAPAMAASQVSPTQAAPGFSPRTGRLSNGLKEFLWQLDGVGHGHLLDLGPAWQTTIMFFIERGFKVYTENLLTTWKNFLDADEQRLRELAPDPDRLDMTPTARAERFLQSTLQHPKGSFDAVLLWDLLDYLDGDLVSRLVTRVGSLVRDGGVVLAIFHARKPEAFHRYRILDAQNLELVPAPCPFAPQRVYQNREISNLFLGFRSSKSFVGRDQLREGLFIK